MIKNFVAIIVGVFVDFVGTLLVGNGLGLIVGTLASFYFILKGYVNAQVDHGVMAIAHDPVFLGIILFVGWFFTFLGGFFAALKSNGHEVVNSVIVGIISTIISIIFNQIYHDPNISKTAIMIGIIGTAPAAVIGGIFMLYIKRSIIHYEGAEQYQQCQ